MKRMLTGEEIAVMTAGAINRALDRLDAEGSRLNQAAIDAGFGHVRIQEFLKMDLPLARASAQVFDQQRLLRFEIDRRFGPGAPSRLPAGRGFGPIKSL